MSAAPVMTEEHEGSVAAAAGPVRVLFVGPSLAPVVGMFAHDERVRALHAASSEDATDALMQVTAGAVDRVVVDQRPGDEAGHPLALVRLAGTLRGAKLVILTGEEQAPLFAPLPHVEAVLTTPVDPVAIVEAVTRREEPAEVPEGFEATPVASRDDDKAAAEDGGERETETTPGFETTLSKIDEADRFVWSKFVPVANFLYKKLAIIVLTSLFLAFATYGAMIVFFMSSSSWSVPFELSKGHALVEKTQRDLASLAVRRNQLAQDRTRARTDFVRAERDEADAFSALRLTQEAVREELAQQGRAGDDLRDHITRLKQMIAEFRKVDGANYARELNQAYRRRLITRKHRDTGALQVLEAMHRLTTINNDLAAKKFEQARVMRRVEFLKSLVDTFEQDRPSMIVSAGSDLVHFAQDLITARNRIDRARKEKALAEARLLKLQASLKVVEDNLHALRASPAARAIEKPIAVLFVPYTNADNYRPGTELYACAFQIVWCREAGAVGPAIGGEVTVVHPLFGKPVRGTFAEALFADAGTSARFVTKELVHASRAPLFF